MAKAKDGDTAKVHYVGKLEDGSVFDSSKDRDPLEFQVGKGHVIPGFEEAVVGMNPGDTKTTKIPFDQAYGPCREEMIQKMDRNQISPEVQLEVGLQLRVTGPDGRPGMVTVTELTDSTVTVDGNHPLAGKELTFEIELIEIT